MNKARRRLQKQRKTRRQWEANFSFADYERSGVETSESIQRSTKVTKIRLDGKTTKPRTRKV